MSETVFVCYSRSDVAFATHAMAVLAERGIACWLDVDRLVPGQDWMRATESALDDCTAVVLIASRESLASPYCRSEWETAARDGKPVVAAAIEQLADLGDLVPAAAIDMRAERWDALEDALRTGSGLRDASIARFRLPGPMRLAALALLALLVFQLAALADSIARIRDTLSDPPVSLTALAAAHVAILIGWIAYTVHWAWRFLHRDATLAGLFWMQAVPLLWLLHTIFGGNGEAMVYIPVLVVGLMYGILWVALGRGLMPWVAARRRTPRPGPLVAAEPAVEAVAAAPLPTRVYNVRAVAQDRRMATRITRALASRGLTAGDEDAAAIVLLSNATSATFEPLYETGSGTRVCVVLSAIDVPEDLATFHRHQWFDHRRCDDEAVDGLARWLRNPTPDNARVLSVEPVELTRGIVPTGPGVVSAFLSFAGGLLIYSTLFPVFELAYKDYAAPPAWGVACGLAAGLLALLTAALIRARAVTYASFVALYLATFALVALVAASQDADTGAYTTLALLVGFGLFAERRVQRAWLLSKRLPWRGGATLAPRPIARVVGRHIALTTLIASAAAVIWASGSALRWF